MTKGVDAVTQAETPAECGFYMPAEWAPHDGCWMMWPCRQEVWSDIEAVKQDYVAIAHAIARFEPVTMAVPPGTVKDARNRLGSDITLAEIPIDDSWARDAGPCFLVDGKGNRAGVNFTFNAWGETYHPYDSDNAFSEFVLSKTGARQFHSKLIAEGGGICVDGEGTLLTTETCFPNANRNPDWSRDEIEAELKAMLGVKKVIWLPGNELETETNGHIDGIAMFVAPGQVLIEDGDEPGDPWGEIKRANIAALDGQTDAQGRSIHMTLIPEALEAESDSDKFCRSYLNGYIANGGFIMPRYGIPADDVAREVFEDVMFGREIVAVSVDALATGGGGIHCITQQVPRA
ncbi:agmatine deiminase family protein [Hwanghaeella sp. 1Z406]|jgi:agmatine deiminase|uniref:agmatine deiminase family protein n=1 Tax=Hwanghaeella sp. 1Z406 TaxID=3402811 RepID=UPI0026D510B6|tara:strand:- start:71304 stop:72344 length:1041 start_codon:yes stop_codon:yes gene_type:complete